MFDETVWGKGVVVGVANMSGYGVRVDHITMIMINVNT